MELACEYSPLSWLHAPRNVSSGEEREERELYLHATLEWSRHRILPTDAKVRTTCLDGLLSFG